jgi:hypothetical protein
VTNNDSRFGHGDVACHMAINVLQQLVKCCVTIDLDGDSKHYLNKDGIYSLVSMWKIISNL